MGTLKEKLTNDLHKALQSGNKSDKEQAYLRLGIYQYNSKKFEESKRSLKQILEFNKNANYVNYYLALIELNLENTEKSKKYLKREIEINPNNKEAILLLNNLKIHTNFPLITITIALLSIIMYYITFPTPNYIQLLKYGLSSLNFTFFSVITSIFIHANLVHLLLNLTILIIFGLYLEKYIGSPKFFLIFILSAIVGNSIETYFLDSTSFVIGISSGLFGILGAIVLREPLLEVRPFGLFKVPIILFFGVIFVINWMAGLYIAQKDVIFGEMSHIFGFLTGVLIIGITQRDTISTFYNWLAMAFGFTIITYGLTRTINLIQNFNTNELLTAITMYLMGIFLIFYSYIKLKLEARIKNKEVYK